MTLRGRFLLLLALVVLSWTAILIGLALTWLAGRVFAAMLGWA